LLHQSPDMDVFSIEPTGFTDPFAAMVIYHLLLHDL
jgi:hypothetical protein